MKYNGSQTIEEHNNILFDKFRKLNLPIGEYCIVSGGALAVRGMRKTGDIDVLVTKRLWDRLRERFKPEFDEPSELWRIIPDKDIEILYFIRSKPFGSKDEVQIKEADHIDGLCFQSLNHCIEFKKILDREKDKKDLLLIKEYLNLHPEEAAKLTVKI